MNKIDPYFDCETQYYGLIFDGMTKTYATKIIRLYNKRLRNRGMRNPIVNIKQVLTGRRI